MKKNLKYYWNNVEARDNALQNLRKRYVQVIFNEIPVYGKPGIIFKSSGSINFDIAMGDFIVSLGGFEAPSI